MPHASNAPRRTLLLTGASRGIGHATVIRFSSAGWRVITCSRHPFPEDCPWDAGPEDHIQVDLGNSEDTARAINEIRRHVAERLQEAGLKGEDKFWNSRAYHDKLNSYATKLPAIFSPEAVRRFQLPSPSRGDRASPRQ